MARILDTEASRLIEQQCLDQQKSQPERNRWGQFATPPELSLDIAKYAYARLCRNRTMLRFIDPAIGTGSFFSAMIQTFPAEMLSHAIGVELDPRFADAARRLWGKHGLRVVQGDFTEQSPPPASDTYSLLLTNPPYVRHHHLTAEQKARLGGRVAARLNLRISGLAGLYCYFLLLSDAWLADGALSIWLIPSEFMDVNYGETIRQYLVENVKLLHIHRFCPTQVQFDDALVSSAIVVFEKSSPGKSDRVEFSFGGSLGKPDMVQYVDRSALRRSHKWTNLFECSDNGRKASSVVLGELFQVTRGVATGNNGFFVLPYTDARRLGIPMRFLQPIIPSPRHMAEVVIEADDKGYPLLDKRLALIDCPLPEEKVQEMYPEFWSYLASGKAKGVHEGYLASRRTPWYSQEKREAPPILCTYMGRGKEHPFRFIRNKSNAIAANVYLLLYPKGELKSRLAEEPALWEKVFEAMRGIGGAEFINEGRVYGGGLHNMEPAELKRLPAEAIAKVAGLNLQKTFAF